MIIMLVKVQYFVKERKDTVPAILKSIKVCIQTTPNRLGPKYNIKNLFIYQNFNLIFHLYSIKVTKLRIPM